MSRKRPREELFASAFLDVDPSKQYPSGAARSAPHAHFAEKETDGYRLEQKRREVDLVKSRPAYLYLRAIEQASIDQARRGIIQRPMRRPQTPDPEEKASKKKWTSNMSRWRSQIAQNIPFFMQRKLTPAKDLGPTEKRLEHAAAALGMSASLRYAFSPPRESPHSASFGLYLRSVPSKAGAPELFVMEGKKTDDFDDFDDQN